MTTACGYTLARQPVALVQRGPWAIVPFFERPFIGIAQPMAQRLTMLLAAEGVPIASVARQSGARIEGALRTETVLSPTRAGIVAYALRTDVEVRLIDAQGEALWQQHIAVADDFLPDATADGQPLQTETNRQYAVGRLAERAATAVHAAIVETFAGSVP